LPIAILVPIRIRIENPQIFPSWESPYDSAKRENALVIGRQLEISPSQPPNWMVIAPSALFRAVMLFTE
jgi:hypothetical protein